MPTKNRFSGFVAWTTMAFSSLLAQGAEPPAVDEALPPLCTPQLVFASEWGKIYAVSPMRKVFARHQPEDWGKITTQNKIRLSLARNESEPFFLVLRPSKELNGVTLSFGRVTQENAGDQAQVEPTWSYQRVAEVPVPGISKWYGMLGLETGTIPDPLLSDKAFTAPAQSNSVLLLQATASFRVKPGLCASVIHVHAEGKTIASVPVELNVWDIALPRTPELQTLTHNLEVKNRASWSFLNDAGVTALKYGPEAPRVRLEPNGTLQIDFTDYKKGLEVVFNELGYEFVLVPPSLLGSISQLSKSYLGLSVPVGSEPFWPIFDQYMKMMGDFYRSHGWEDRVIFYMFDEINEEHHQLVIKLAQRAKRHYPEVKVMISTHVMSDALASVLDAWCVPWHFFATEVEHIPNWQKWQREGLELWAYMNSLYTLNAKSSLAANRFYPSVLAKYGYRGNFWWGIAYNAGKNPWTDPHRHGNQKEGMYANGLLFYPPRDRTTTEFEPWHSSLRWESYRQGLDEYNLMTLFSKTFATVRRDLGAPGQQEIFSDQQVSLQWGALLSTEFRKHTYRADGEYIHRFRQLLAHEIQTLRQQPLGIVQLEHDSGPYTASNTIRIRGVCAAGTMVTVAGERLSKEQGFSATDPFGFVAKVPLHPGRNLIPIQLEDDQGNKKTFYREIDYRVPENGVP